ncbi:formin-like protein 5 [Heterocephalus glaber]|uniref:Formin-like protein 5 n=1 Tax=Heterocephalus glaber TaxID=10181 RepID=A0AAX6RH23_HETGA|nr:formin-like protein 5 [Heterocephalus glaber]
MGGPGVSDVTSPSPPLAQLQSRWDLPPAAPPPHATTTGLARVGSKPSRAEPTTLSAPYPGSGPQRAVSAAASTPPSPTGAFSTLGTQVQPAAPPPPQQDEPPAPKVPAAPTLPPPWAGVPGAPVPASHPVGDLGLSNVGSSTGTPKLGVEREPWTSSAPGGRTPGWRKRQGLCSLPPPASPSGKGGPDDHLSSTPPAWPATARRAVAWGQRRWRRSPSLPGGAHRSSRTTSGSDRDRRDLAWIPDPSSLQTGRRFAVGERLESSVQVLRPCGLGTRAGTRARTRAPC